MQVTCTGGAPAAPTVLALPLVLTTTAQHSTDSSGCAFERLSRGPLRKGEGKIAKIKSAEVLHFVSVKYASITLSRAPWQPSLSKPQVRSTLLAQTV